MRTKAEDVLDEWMHCINTGDLPGVLALYDETAVLIPTFSNRLLNRPEGIREYFERLAARDQLSISLHPKTLIVQPIKDALCAVSGIYLWRFAIDSDLFNFEARFSYLLDYAKPNPILHHHSSQIPRMI